MFIKGRKKERQEGRWGTEERRKEAGRRHGKVPVGRKVTWQSLSDPGSKQMAHWNWVILRELKRGIIYRVVGRVRESKRQRGPPGPSDIWRPTLTPEERGESRGGGRARAGTGALRRDGEILPVQPQHHEWGQTGPGGQPAGTRAGCRVDVSSGGLSLQWPGARLRFPARDGG